MRQAFNGRQVGRRSMIGLDIGSSAIRAVELGRNRDRPTVVRFGQVGLARGVVVEGEVRDAASLAVSLRRLWAEAGFTSRLVNVSAGGQRVIVREADVPAMSADDFRTAMVFEVQDLIPIPTTDAVLDFSILGEAPPGRDGRPRMRIMLAAAARVGVERLLDALRLAGLEAAAVDVTQAALLRATRRLAGQAVDGLISVGADLTTVIVRTPEQTFSRTLAIGASEVTKGIGLRLGTDVNEAEAVKRYAGGSDRAAARAGALVVSESGPLVEQIIESIDYFLSQAGTDRLERLVVTGGGSGTVGLVGSLESRTGTEVVVADPFDGIDMTGLDPEVELRARAVAAHAVGLAQWTWDAPGDRLTLLPPEIREAQQHRKAVITLVAAGVVLAVGLSAVWYSRDRQVVSVNAEAASVNAQSAALQASNAAESDVNSYFSAVAARQSQLSSLGGGIDWPALISQIEATLPPQLTLQTIDLQGPTASVASGATTPTPGTPATVQMTISGQGGEAVVATYLEAMSRLSSLANVVVPSSSTTATGTTTFASTATVTAAAPRTTYSWEAKK